jgi:hypothetical protein
MDTPVVIPIAVASCDCNAVHTIGYTENAMLRWAV